MDLAGAIDRDLHRTDLFSSEKVHIVLKVMSVCYGKAGVIDFFALFQDILDQFPVFFCQRFAAVKGNVLSRTDLVFYDLKDRIHLFFRHYLRRISAFFFKTVSATVITAEIWHQNDTPLVRISFRAKFKSY